MDDHGYFGRVLANFEKAKACHGMAQASYVRAKEIANKYELPPRPLAKADPENGSAALYLYDDIGESSDRAGITAKDVADALGRMKGAAKLDIHINSVGGSVFEGIAILSQLDQFPARKTVYVDGIAASIASVIAMAGDRIIMHRAAKMMIHDPFVNITSNSAGLREMANVLDGLADSLVAAYAGRTRMDETQIRALMKSETYMSADEAIKYGFAHEVAVAAEARAAAMTPAPPAYTEIHAKIAEQSAEAMRILSRRARPTAPGKSGTTPEKN